MIASVGKIVFTSLGVLFVLYWNL